MQNDIMFDNIFIGHSVEDANKFADETFHEKHPIEQLIELAEKPKTDNSAKTGTVEFKDDPIAYMKEKLDLFISIAKKDPIQAIKFVPEAAGGIAAVVVTLIAVIAAIFTMGGTPTPPPQVKKAAEKTKEAAVDAKDKVTEAVASGAEQAKAEVNKRTTRSSS